MSDSEKPDQRIDMAAYQRYYRQTESGKAAAKRAKKKYLDRKRAERIAAKLSAASLSASSPDPASPETSPRPQGDTRER